MITAAIAVTILVALTILVHYEVLRVASVLIPEERHVRPRFRVVLVVFACFAAHTIEVWLFALEALVGLLMIGWSASFTYLAMEKFWPMHGDRKWPLGSARRGRRQAGARKDGL